MAVMATKNKYISYTGGGAFVLKVSSLVSFYDYRGVEKSGLSRLTHYQENARPNRATATLLSV